MGLFRKNWPHRRYLAGQASFKALREPGPKLWPHPQKRCADRAPFPAELERLPGIIQCAVKKGVQQALRDRSNLGWVGVSSLPPQNAAPFKSQPINQTLALIVGGGHAAQQAAATELQAAVIGSSNQVGAAAAQIVVANPANSVNQADPAVFLTLVAGSYERVHFAGVDFAACSADAYTNLLFSVKVDGLTVIDRVSLAALRKLSVDCKPFGQIQLLVASSDTVGVYLAYLTVLGWRYQVTGLGDYASESLFRSDPDGREAEDDCSYSDEDVISELAGSTNTGGCS